MKFADFVLICSLILMLGGCKSAPERSAEAPAVPGPAGNYPNLSAQANELAQALKERLQVTSGDDILRVLPDGSIEKTVLSDLTGLAFLASSVTWARLSLSISGRAGFGG